MTALEYPSPAERAAFLDQACASNRSLRQAVEALLRNHQSDEFLERPAVDFGQIPRPKSADPERTGRGFKERTSCRPTGSAHTGCSRKSAREA